MPSRRVAFVLVSILSLLCTAFGPPVLTDSDIPRQKLPLNQVRAMGRVPVPDITAPSAIMANTTTGQIVYARNEHERRAPGSLVKIVTALVALQRGRQDQEIVVDRKDLWPGSVLGLRSDEELNVRQLLFALLISSDNAAGMTLARGLAGDVRTFVGWMNDLVSRWGLVDTHFGNPHGLDDEDTYSTAYDMAIIARYAMGDQVFADIVRRPEAIVAYREIESTNELLTIYSGAIGVKTGTTDLAGECLAALVDRPSGQVLCVVMGSEDRYYDARLLLDYYYANFAELHIDLTDTPQNRYLDMNNSWHQFGLREPLTFLISPWQMSTVSVYRRIEDASANPNPDKPIGALEVTVGGNRLAEAPLYVR